MVMLAGGRSPAWLRTIKEFPSQEHEPKNNQAFRIEVQAEIHCRSSIESNKGFE
jgi:hypothetical protein